jgi:hypothetical protein
MQLRHDSRKTGAAALGRSNTTPLAQSAAGVRACAVGALFFPLTLSVRRFPKHHQQTLVLTSFH